MPGLIRNLASSLKRSADKLCYRFLMLSSRGSDGRRPYDTRELDNLTQALKAQNLFGVSGTFQPALTAAFASTYGVSHAVACSSGTAALHVALASLGLEPGDEVITTPISDFGTLFPILAVGATPVFADIDRSYCLDPEAVRRGITDRTRAVVAVHLFGNTCDIESLKSICAEHNLFLIEDCAQAHATSYRGQFVGTFGDIGCFSFQQSKHMTTGDGGMAITNRPELAETMAQLVDKGYVRTVTGGREHRAMGPNYRMNELTAAVGLAQLTKLRQVVKRRNELGTRLAARLSEWAQVTVPPAHPDACHSYWSFPLAIKGIEAERLAQLLRDAGVNCGVHLSRPLYDTVPAFLGTQPRRCSATGTTQCPVAETLQHELVQIWIHEGWSDARADAVAAAVGRIAGPMEPADA